ncbi:hypothetical protein ACFLQ6_00625 [Thermoproteota archaeon]
MTERTQAQVVLSQMISIKLLIMFKMLFEDLVNILLGVKLMSREHVCGECGRLFSPNDLGQVICKECNGLNEYIMARSNRYCRNCFS